MKKRLIASIITFVMILSTISSSPIYAQQKEEISNKGSLVIVGGALGSSNEKVYNKFIELAGGKEDCKIGIIPAASSKLSSSGDFKKDLVTYGVQEENIEILALSKHDFKKTDEDESVTWQGNENSSEISNKIKSLTGIWMVGGDQTLITQALLNEDGTNSNALDAIWDMYKKGGVIGGSSAGAAVMSDIMLAGGDSLGSLKEGFATNFTDMSQQEYGPAILERGLGFFEYGIVDQHFDEKARLGRLIVTAFEKGDKNQYAYGIDEDTALVVENVSKTAEIVGRGGVAIVDVSLATKNYNNSLTEMDGIKLSYLQDGDEIDLENKTFIIEEGRASASTKGYEYMSYHAVPQTGALTPYGKLERYLAYALMDNDRQDEVKSYTYDEKGVGFELTFKSVDDSEGWFGTIGEKEVYSIANVEMSIKPIEINFEKAKFEGYKNSKFVAPEINTNADEIKGSLVIVGGAATPNSEYYNKFVTLAGGKENAKIGIIPAASSKLNSSNNFMKIMKNLGVKEENVEILHLSKHDFKKTDENESIAWQGNENSDEISNKIKKLTGIWMVGGDQTLITQALLNEDGTNTKALDSIWDMYKNGGVLGGTSAGAAVMSDVMLAGGDSLGTLKQGFINEDEYTDMGQQEYGPSILAQGLGFFRYGIIDQHFDQKARIGRLIATQYENGNKNQYAYGVDENTALIINNKEKTAEISGDGGVTVIDMSMAERTIDNGYKDITISHLRPGDKINLSDKSMIFNPNKYETKGYEYNEYIALPNSGVLSNHGTLKNFLAYGLTDNLLNSIITTYSFDDKGIGFKIDFRKTDTTNGYWGYSDGQKDDYSSYKVAMDIVPIKADIEYKMAEPIVGEFADMPNDWSTQAIQNCYRKGLLKGFEENGHNLIKPTAHTTRAQMATMLNRIFNNNNKADLKNVLDIPSDSWYADEMAKATFMGIFVKDTYMRPNDDITRQEAMTVIARAFNIKSETNSTIESFQDASELSSWAKEGVKVLVAKGYIKGNNGYLNPKSYITRAELCKLLDLVLKDNTVENIKTEEVIVETKSSKKKPSSGNSSNTIIEGLHAVTETTILAEGNNSNEFKLGFRYANDMTGVTAYMMVYSVKDINEVLSSLKDKTRAEFDDYGTKEINQGKLITNLDYADGAANTYYSSQKDIITNQEITEPELYHFYVLSLSTDGLIGIAEADKTIDKRPFPKDMIATRSGGYALENYGVEFDTFSDDRIVNNIIFYSELGESNTRGLVSGLTSNQIKELADNNRAMFTGRDLVGGMNFLSTLKDFEGNGYNPDKIYYIYALAVSEDGALGLSKADLMLTPANGPAPLTNIGTGKGFVIPAGGATSLNPNSKTYVQSYIDAFKQATPSITPRVAVFETSSGAESTMYDYFYNDGDSSDKVVLEKDGCEAVYIPLGIDNYESITNEKYFADLVKSCHVVLLMGGDQAKHARALTNDDGSLTEVGKAIKYVYEQGGTIAGTSAGAQVLSKPAFQGGGNGSYEAMFWNDTEELDMSDYNGKTDSDVDSSKALNNIAYNSTGYVDLAAGRRVLLDTHFDARGRLGRLLVALRDTNNGITTGTAIGLDEGTGIRISEGTHIGTVFGNGGVFIVDADEAIWNDGEVFGVSNIKLNYLTEGDTYNFDSKEITTSKNIIVDFGESVKTKENAFGTYQVSKILLELAKSAENKVVVSVIKAEGTEFATGPEFEVTFEKVGSTICYSSDENYVNGSAGANIGEYNKTTIDNIKMSISAKEPAPDPLSIIEVFTNKGYDAKIEFNNSLKVGLALKNNYLVDLYKENAEYYITIKRGDQTLTQDKDSSLGILEGNILRIVLAKDEDEVEVDFEAGDKIIIHKTVADVFGQKLSEELVYVLNADKIWVIVD